MRLVQACTSVFPIATRATSYEPFTEGWLEGESAYGWPVDLQELPDGSMLVSDDIAGMISGIKYTK